MKRCLLTMGVVATGLGLAAPAGAVLVWDPAKPLVAYDTELNVTWLTDANYYKTLNPATTGRLNHASADAFVANLTLPIPGFETIKGWRLPTSENFDGSTPICGSTSPSGAYNCTKSELGHLYYTELKAIAPPPIFVPPPPQYPGFNNGTSPQKSYFTNIPAPTTGSPPGDFRYWSDTPSSSATYFTFRMEFGQQVGGYNAASTALVWPVIDGDPYQIVPIPPAILLFGSALAGLGGLGYSRRRLG